ncbi:FAD-dependent monooxygenase [Actinomadura algeriensis]|uniref:2-polyprenyl-6-methoxyphenol hydroxylase-like FAD-dependent oxidoreductase n=1 Tax=Actinomadura algeriensis TaxID=1679523 RepID=A0ABR9K2P3_9ACTN|nr:FAD-dependent monooxygenase [Actinomadura algeriensis]MBE1537129.1 2-polyprenyl-6-methoxyphenol hydroxylase-like FAD-dependent oxidoreductase [Actinomadura algeriensis]
MYRPEPNRILADAARDAGARIRFGLTVDALDDRGDHVAAHLSDGTTARHDLVVGADGVRSTVRRLVGIGTEPRPTGMGIWRVHTRRPERVERTDLVYGGACFIAGYCPTGPDHHVRVPGGAGAPARVDRRRRQARPGRRRSVPAARADRRGQRRGRGP